MIDKRILGILAMLLVSAIFAAWWRGNFSSRASASETRILVGEREYRVELAESLAQQAQGLSGRTSLEDGKGMLFIFPAPRTQSFWMRGMQFPIDIIWIREGKVIGFVEHAPVPVHGQLPVFTSPGPADQVLEVIAGTVAKDAINIGDTVVRQ